MPVSRAQDTPQNGTLLKLQSDCRQLSFLYYKKTAFKSILAGTFKNCIAYNRSPLNTNLVYHGIVRFVKYNLKSAGQRSTPFRLSCGWLTKAAPVPQLYKNWSCPYFMSWLFKLEFFVLISTSENTSRKIF